MFTHGNTLHTTLEVHEFKSLNIFFVLGCLSLELII